MSGRFNLSHDHTTTGLMGRLIPVGCQEVLPGDMFRQQTSALIRTSPLLSPVMHPVYARIHHFFVPNRLVDPNWEDFITGKDGRDATNPTVALVGNSVADYFGLQVQAGDTILAHPLRAYNLIWNEFFRDQDLQDPAAQDQQAVLRVAWGRDYFTQARPEPQQGPAVTIPLIGGGQFPVEGLYLAQSAGATNTSYPVQPDGTMGTAESIERSVIYGARGGNQINSDLDPMPSVDVSASGIDINALRQALYIQMNAENRARYGSRYVDLLRSFGVSPQDSRLDRPELLGGASKALNFSEVVATAEGTNVEVGDLYGHGIGVVSHRPYRRMFPEHGYVMSLLSVVPKTQYMTSVPKQFLRTNPQDYWFPESEIEGPQPVANREVYSASVDPTGVWGWTGRHDEYRSRLSYVSGEIRDTLDTYTYARDFDSFPALNGFFIESIPTDRVYSDPTVDPMRVFVSHKISARRPVSQQPMV